MKINKKNIRFTIADAVAAQFDAVTEDSGRRVYVYNPEDAKVLYTIVIKKA